MRTKKNGLSYPDVPYSVGPWRTTGKFGYTVSDGHLNVAEAGVIGRKLKAGFSARAIRQANAKLIALAPDMADALYELTLQHCHVLRDNLADSYCRHLRLNPATGMLTCSAKCGTCYNQRNIELLDKIFGWKAEGEEGEA